MKKAIRLTLGALLPVLLYCAGAAILTFKEILREDPKNMIQIAVLWLGYGFLIMGLPSLIYSGVIEYLRSKKRKGLGTCVLAGGLLGLFAGSILLVFDFEPAILLSMSLPGTLIGMLIPVILWPIRLESEPVAGVNSVTSLRDSTP